MNNSTQTINYNVLIVDDEKPARTAIMALGNWNHYNVSPPHFAINGQDGLSAMREIHPDIVFIDMHMPIMDGIEFLKIATSEFKQTKYIVVSGYDEFQYAQSAIKNGAIDYILKPIVEEELNRALKKAVDLLNQENNITDADVQNSGDTAETNAFEVIELIKETIEKHYCENLNLSTFSDQYFFTKSYLSKLFKKTYGYGVYEYVLHLRMERSKELLQDMEIQIKEISERLGYSDNNYFSKAFKNYYAISPTEYRESLK